MLTTRSGRSLYFMDGRSDFDLDALIAACHEAACRPPGSGGTGGSSPTSSAHNYYRESQRLLKDSQSRGAVASYCAMGYARLNEILRTFRGKKTNGMVTEMDTAFEEAGVKLKDSIMVSRGAVFGNEGDTIKDTAEWIKTLFRVGAEFTDHGYTSTTYDDEVSKTFATGYGVSVRFKMRLAAGVRVLAGSSSESELILNRGTLMRVTSINEHDDGSFTIEVDVDE